MMRYAYVIPGPTPAHEAMVVPTDQSTKEVQPNECSDES